MLHPSLTCSPSLSLSLSSCCLFSSGIVIPWIVHGSPYKNLSSLWILSLWGVVSLFSFVSLIVGLGQETPSAFFSLFFCFFYSSVVGGNRRRRCSTPRQVYIRRRIFPIVMTRQIRWAHRHGGSVCENDVWSVSAEHKGVDNGNEGNNGPRPPTKYQLKLGRRREREESIVLIVREERQ